jgi:hypothetical protein
MNWPWFPSHRRLRATAALAGLVFTAVAASHSQELGSFGALTRNYNNQRTGANVAETVLDATNVNAGQFGKLFQLPVDDQVYAGILYASGVAIAGGTHNVVYVATVSNTVYAFDADTLGLPLWQRNFNGSGGRPTRNTEVGGACGTYRDFSGNIGIVGTPVIDGAATPPVMYFMARTVDSDGVTRHRLRAIDIGTGNDRAGAASVVISASGFSATLNNQRPGLALSQGVVYLGFSSFCDTGDYHGMLLAYDAASLSQTGAFNTTPSGTQGGIWMAGAAPAFDAAGNVYAATANGTFDNSANFGQSMVKLRAPDLARLDWFTPSNWMTLNGNDWDYGSSGPVFLPGTNFLVNGGKDKAGKGFLLDAGNLGHVVSGNTQIPQVFQAIDTTVRPSNTHHLHNAMVAWNGPAGLNLYVWGENDFLRAFRFDASSQRLTEPAFTRGTVLPPIGMPGGVMTLSADGSVGGTGILWATVPRAGDANQAVVPGVLHAFDAELLGSPLWSSSGPGDDPLNFSKGSPPLVANGRVYLASLSNVVSVYGLKTNPRPPQNLALNKTATGSAPCNANEAPPKAVNGSVSGGNSDKWCSLASGTKSLQVDLGASVPVSQVVIEHAGAGGETFDWNTRAYDVQLSTDGASFGTVASVGDNIQSITTHNIPVQNARFVRLNVNTPTQTTDAAARIYELAVYGPAAGGPAMAMFEAESTPVGGFTAGRVERVALDAGYSGGQGVILEGHAAGDFLTFNVDVPEARTYDVVVRLKRLGNRGTWQLDINGTNQGWTVDGFGTAASFPEIDLGNASFPTAGVKSFRFRVTGKAASSTDFWVAIDYIKLIPR